MINVLKTEFANTLIDYFLAEATHDDEEQLNAGLQLTAILNAADVIDEATGNELFALVEKAGLPIGSFSADEMAPLVVPDEEEGPFDYLLDEQASAIWLKQADK